MPVDYAFSKDTSDAGREFILGDGTCIIFLHKIIILVDVNARVCYCYIPVNRLNTCIRAKIEAEGYNNVLWVYIRVRGAKAPD